MITTNQGPQTTVTYELQWRKEETDKWRLYSASHHLLTFINLKERLHSPTDSGCYHAGYWTAAQWRIMRIFTTTSIVVMEVKEDK